ncbi:hypothetical protein CPB86DRAFT_413590 [Serendipita vermifera]|nr:hypothetical protein CPB86DRAFT_413590 [Serendipita vermifera]
MLVKMVEYRWFYEEFALANGLAWLTRIALSALHSKDRRLKDSVPAEILVDQIRFSTANRDVQAPLLSCYHYLQSLGQVLHQTHDLSDFHQRSRQMILEDTESSFRPASSNTSSLNSLVVSVERGVAGHITDIHRLFNLRVSLLWALYRSIKVYNMRNHVEPPLSLRFEPPVLEREYWPTVGDVRTFSFIRDLSGGEWKTWVDRLKVLIMGASLGGLKPGPSQNTDRFRRDPDGFCGRI